MTELRERRSGEGFTLLVLDRPKIASIFMEGGSAFRFARSVVREITLLAREALYPGHGFRTGEMYLSLGDSVTPAGFGEIFANVRATADHSIYYHEGTEPHTISARNGEFLIFDQPHGSGIMRRARTVEHPGFAGHPFLRESMETVLARRGIART